MGMSPFIASPLGPDGPIDESGRSVIDQTRPAGWACEAGMPCAVPDKPASVGQRRQFGALAASSLGYVHPFGGTRLQGSILPEPGATVSRPGGIEQSARHADLSVNHGVLPFGVLFQHETTTSVSARFGHRSGSGPIRETNRDSQHAPSAPSLGSFDLARIANNPFVAGKPGLGARNVPIVAACASTQTAADSV